MKIRHHRLKVRDHKIQMEFQTALLTRSIRLYRPAPSKTTLSLRPGSKQEIGRTTPHHWHGLQNNSEGLKRLICLAMAWTAEDADQKLVSLKGVEAMAWDVNSFSLRRQVQEAQSLENQIRWKRKAHRELLLPLSLLLLPTWTPSQLIQVQPP